MKTLPPDPFAGHPNSPGRLARARSLSRAECHDALERDRMEPYLQGTVRQAIIQHLRRIEYLEETR